MVPVEAMASGHPVVAFGRGGAIETVAKDVSGVFFAEQTVEAISSAVGNLAGIEINPVMVAAHASQFGRDQFFQKMRANLTRVFSSSVSGGIDHRQRFTL